MGPHTNTAELEIRRAQPAELARVRRLAPDLYKAGSAPDRVIVAVRSAASELIGIAAIAWRNWGQPPGFPVYVHVTDEWRCKGVGRALVSAAARECRSDIDRFYGWSSVDEPSAAWLFARAVGFHVHRRTLHFEADVLTFYSMVNSIHERLSKHARIPPAAKIVTLASVPPAPVARLLSETFGTPYERVLANVEGKGPGAHDAERSVVLIVNGEVQGALLYRWADGTPEIDANVVAAHLRGGWANVVLLRHATQNGLAAGARRFRFLCDDTIADTVNLARRANARVIRTAIEFSCALDDLLQNPRKRRE